MKDKEIDCSEGWGTWQVCWHFRVNVILYLGAKLELWAGVRRFFVFFSKLPCVWRQFSFLVVDGLCAGTSKLDLNISLWLFECEIGCLWARLLLRL